MIPPLIQMTSLQKNIVYRKTRGYCKYCGIKLIFEEMVITHKIPPSRGGTDAISNLIPVCLPCLEYKGSMTHVELRRKRKRLRERHKKRIKSIARKKEILDKTNGLCAYCGAKLTLESMTVDHIISISRGGENDLNNLVPACWDCNYLKGSMTFEKFNAININHSELASKKPVFSFSSIVSMFQWFLRLGKQERTEGWEISCDRTELRIYTFLNYPGGGHIYVGIEKDGTIIGVENIDEAQLKIIDWRFIYENLP